MAIATYAEDLSDFNLAENDGTAWLEFTGWAGGGAPDEADAEAEVQGTYCTSQSVNTTGLCPMYRDYGSGVTVPTDGAFFVWILFSFPGVLASFSNGGMRVCVGSSIGNFMAWKVAGNDVDPSPYGGWRNFAVNPTIDSTAISLNVVAVAGTITRASGSFLADGFAPRQSIVTTGFTNGGNNTTKVISSVTATVITVTDTTGLVNETGGGDERVRMTDYIVGTPTTTRQCVGGAINLVTAISKGQPFAVDAIRYGRGEARFSGGTSPDSACTFAGFATQNDSDAYMWGLIQSTSGGYLWKGLMTLGYGAAVRFTDSNIMVMTADTQKVSAAFNKVEIRNSSSEINWTNISFLQLGASTTVSKASLEVVDDCDVNLSGCVFTDWSTFIFQAASSVSSCVFRRCNTITANDCNFAGTLFDLASVDANTSQLVWNVATNPSADLTGCTFTKGANAHHAIEFGTSSPTAITLTNITFTGFNASSAANDSVLHIMRTSGTVSITLSGTSEPSYKSEGATVEFISSARTIKVAVTSISGAVSGANVILLADSGGPFPAEEQVTSAIRATTTVTVTHTAHGMATNDVVLIYGITDHTEDNGVHTITRLTDDTYTFASNGSGSATYAGTIFCTFVFLKGLANSGTDSNEISMSRTISSNQPVVGWARKSSGAPYYKQGVIGGNVISTGDTTFSPVLIADS